MVLIKQDMPWATFCPKAFSLRPQQETEGNRGTVKHQAGSLAVTQRPATQGQGLGPNADTGPAVLGA